MSMKPKTVGPAVKFNTLWQQHPTVRGNQTPCVTREGAPAYKDQCAIRMGVCFEQAGLSLSSYKGTRCDLHRKHTLRVEEFCKWLSSSPYRGWPKVESMRGPDFQRKLRGRTGIVVFLNYYGAGNRGDHIDLWNGSRLSAWITGIRLSLGLHRYDQAERVLFWAIEWWVGFARWFGRLSGRLAVMCSPASSTSWSSTGSSRPMPHRATRYPSTKTSSP